MLTAIALRAARPIPAAAGAYGCAVLVVFLFSLLFDNSSLFDPFWSLAPIPVALSWAAGSGRGIGDPKSAATLALVLVWGARLTLNWALGWRGLSHEDWRYGSYRARGPLRYWVTSFFGFHVFPAAMTMCGLVPLYSVFRAGRTGFAWADVPGVAVSMSGLLVEAAADAQLRRFRKNSPNGASLMTRGLWRHARHPNYLGEVLLWAGFSISGFAASGNPALLLCFVPILAMFRAVSVPMMEAHLRETRAGHADHAKARRVFLPLPKRKRKRA